MSGHSKWSTIKHKKAKLDAKKGAIFTRISKEMFAAAKAGGTNPDNNLRLKIAIQKARDANMTKDSINRALAKAEESAGGDNYEEIVYEGYGPGGVAILLEILTDNRNRTASDVRHLFTRFEGNLGATGCVAWMFDKKGQFMIDKEGLALSEDELLDLVLEAGAEDMKIEDDHIEITTLPEDFMTVRTALEEAEIKPEMAELSQIPQNTIEASDEDAVKLEKLLEMLEEHDDVQNVYSNLA